MTQLYPIAETHLYWHAAEQAERERTARRHVLAAQVRKTEPRATERPRRALVPRIVGALGLF